MNRISINGNIVRGNISGGSIIVNNNRVIIDGIDVTPDAKQITIKVEGDVNEVSVDACDTLEITGNVTGSVKTLSGDAIIGGDVGGSVQTMSGDVKCNGIGGSVSTMSGDIRGR